MFTIFYIAMLLLQISFGKQLSEYETTTEELGTPLSNELTEEDFVQGIEPSSVKASGINLKTADDILPDEENDDDDIEEPVEPISTANFGGPVKSQEAVMIATQHECTGHTSDEMVPEDSGDDLDEPTPISFSGPVKAHGKVSIATHFGYEENIGNLATSHEMDSKDIVNEEVSDDPVCFVGPVHAQGKISIGTHFGCGPQLGTPPIFLPLPQFSTVYFPYFHPSYYSIPGSFLAQYPFPMPETSPFTTPRLLENHTDNEARNFSDLQELPIASILADLIPDGSNEFEEDTDGNMSFNGVVPVSGTVSIAARF